MYDLPNLIPCDITLCKIDRKTCTHTYVPKCQLAKNKHSGKLLSGAQRREISFAESDIKSRVTTDREKYMENEIFSRSGKSQGILLMSKEI